MQTFLSADWGTSNFRLRLVRTADMHILEELENDKGIATIYDEWTRKGADNTTRIDFFLQILKDAIANIEEKQSRPITDVPIVISGMVSSSIGMMEIPYREIPTEADGAAFQTGFLASTDDFRHDLYIISGLSTSNDVLRGEETILVGIAPLMNNQDFLVILPGTHSKHIYISNGMITGFETYMTGEFFELLSEKSILKNSVHADGILFDTEAFSAGVLSATENNLLHSGFLVRTNLLFKRFNKESNTSFLSGLLIGTELSMLVKNESEIFLVANDLLKERYLHAMKVLEIGNVKTVDVKNSLVQGQWNVLKRCY